MDIEIRLFGPLEVLTPSGRLTSNDFPSRKAKQVLQVLALAEGRVVSKDRLIDTLWRRRMPRNPAATVELAVSLLRSTLLTVTDRTVIVTAPGGYRLDPEVADVDTARFEQLLLLSSESPPADRAPMLVEAVGLADRPLFEDELSADWVANDRERFRAKAEAAALDLGRLALAVDDTALALAMAERAWRSSDFVVEEAYALGIAALAQMGRRDQARSLLAELEARLEHEEARALSPSSVALRGLFDAATARGHDEPVSVPADFAHVALPVPFLGRVKEMRAAQLAVDESLAAASARVVVVEGQSGTGVSRFLHELADRVAEGSSVKVFTMQGQAADQAHPMLAVSHLLRTLSRATKSRKQVVIDDSVAAMFARVADLFESVGPALLLVDDADLLDESSAAVVRALLAPGAIAGLCVVVGVRGPSDDPANQQWSLPASVRVVLGPLSEAEMAPTGVDGAWRLTGGHAATFAACVSAAHRDGVLTADELAAIVHRADDLSELGRAVLAVVAHADRPVKASEAAHALHIGQSNAADLLRRAAAAGLLRGTVRYGQELSSDLLAQVLRSRRIAATPGTPPISLA